MGVNGHRRSDDSILAEFSAMVTRRRRGGESFFDAAERLVIQKLFREDLQQKQMAELTGMSCQAINDKLKKFMLRPKDRR